MKYSDLRVGMKLKADGGFTCLEAGDICEVRKDERGRLCISCGEGNHRLKAQVDFDDGETLVGLELVEV